jgi:hypothetical protein
MKAYEGVGLWISGFLTSALVGGQFRPPPRPRRLSPDIIWIGGHMDARGSLENMVKRKFLSLPGLEIRPPPPPVIQPRPPRYNVCANVTLTF